MYVLVTEDFVHVLLTMIQAEDPRLDCAILRPMESDGDHFLAYYLTKDDASAIAFKEARFHPDFSYSDEKEACILVVPMAKML